MSLSSRVELAPRGSMCCGQHSYSDGATLGHWSPEESIMGSHRAVHAVP